MALWQDMARKQMPSLKRLVRRNDTPMALWIDLEFRLDRAYEGHELTLIRQIYGYAHWSFFEAQDEELAEAVGCAFYEHLPLNPVVKRDLPNWLTREEFQTLSPVFRYHQSDAEFQELCDCFGQGDGGATEVV